MMLPLYLFFLFAPADTHRQSERLPLPTAEADDLSGIYLCEGRQGTKAYAGACVVTRVGSTYLFAWQASGELSNTTGIGFRDGDRVQVGWSTPNGKGVTSYRLVGNGVLVGRWCTLTGGGTDGGVHSETLTLLKRLPVE